MQGLLSPTLHGQCRSSAARAPLGSGVASLKGPGSCSSSSLAPSRWRTCPRQSAKRSGLEVRAVAEVEAPKRGGEASVSIDNKSDPTYTVVSVVGYSKPGLLTSLSSTFRDLGLDVGKVR